MISSDKSGLHIDKRAKAISTALHQAAPIATNSARNSALSHSFLGFIQQFQQKFRRRSVGRSHLIRFHHAG